MSFSSFFYVTDKRKSKNQKVSESGRGKRYSYKLPQEYNIETIVVADPAMVSYHGTDAARRFILTILNMVGNLKSNLALCQPCMHDFIAPFNYPDSTPVRDIEYMTISKLQRLTPYVLQQEPWCYRLISSVSGLITSG